MPDITWPILGCLLSAPNHRTSRTRLAAQLWPEQSDVAARRRFATALWRVRSQLSGTPTLIATQGEHVALGVDPSLWVDAVAFERRARMALRQPSRLAEAVERRRLAHALDLYRGDFLADRDQEWIVVERSRLRSLYLDAMYALTIAAAQAGEWTEVRLSAARLCAAEPLREDAQRLLIEAYARCGQRTVALQQYRRCEALLQAELGVTPMVETRALADLIRRLDAAPAAPVHSWNPLPEHDRSALIATRGKVVETLQIIDRALLI